MIDSDAASDTTPTSNSESDVSQKTQTYNGTETMTDKYASFELNSWILDGTFKILPDNISGIQTGWRSGISGADCQFATPVTLTFTFTADHSSAGFTLFFDDKCEQYPPEITISAYDSSDVLIDSDTFTITNVWQIFNLPVENYRKVVFSFSETFLPYQSVRIAQVIFGIIERFDSDNSTDSTILYEISPSAESLPTNEFTLTIDNTDKRYNMLNPSSIYSYMEETQELEVELAIDDEYVNMGKFNFTKAESEDESMTAKITANDLFYKLDSSVCSLGESGTWTVSDAVAAVIADSGLTITTDIPSAVGARTVNKCIPVNTSHREALRLIAQAEMSTCFFNRDNELQFYEFAEGSVVDTLDNDNMYKSAKITKDTTNKVVLTVKR